MMNNKRIGFCFIVLLALLSCREQNNEVSNDVSTATQPGNSASTVNAASSGDTAGAQSPIRLLIEVPMPWGVTVTPGRNNDRLIATVSHNKDQLIVWSITNDRIVTELDRADTGFHPDDLSWIDWDADGDVRELLVVVEGRSEIQLWQFNNDSKLEKSATFKVDDPPQNALIQDIDKDGNFDIILGPYQSERISILWGQGGFTFEKAFLPAEMTPSYPTLVDWNKDGLVDIAWSDWYHGTIRIAFNKGGRDFELHRLRDAQTDSPRQVMSGDVNGDGWPDLVAALETGKSALVFYNDGAGNVASQNQIPAPLVGYSSVAITGSGENALLALSETKVIVLAKPKLDDKTNDKIGWQLKQILDNRGLALDLQFYDIDNDGKLDLVLANSSGDAVEVFFGPLWESARPLELEQE